MENEHSKIGEMFRRAFEDFKPEPPDRVWENISQSPQMQPVKPSKGLSWWKVLITGLSVTAIVGITLVIISELNKEQQDKAVAGNTEVIAAPAAEPSATVQPPVSEDLTSQSGPVGTESNTLSRTDPVDQVTHSPRHVPARKAQVDSQAPTRSAPGIITGPALTAAGQPAPVPIPASLHQQASSAPVPAGMTTGHSLIPKNDIEIIGDQQICKGEQAILWASGGTTYYWNTGEETDSIHVTPETTTTYFITVTDHAGIPTQGTVTVSVVECESILIPNAFTPGIKDGVNDEFRVFGNNISGFTMRIVSRSGQIVFETNDISQGWDGNIQGKMAEMGVYVYQITYTDSNGQQHTRTGQLTLLK